MSRKESFAMRALESFPTKIYPAELRVVPVGTGQCILDTKGIFGNLPNLALAPLLSTSEQAMRPENLWEQINVLKPPYSLQVYSYIDSVSGLNANIAVLNPETAKLAQSTANQIHHATMDVFKTAAMNACTSLVLPIKDVRNPGMVLKSILGAFYFHQKTFPENLPLKPVEDLYVFIPKKDSDAVIAGLSELSKIQRNASGYAETPFTPEKPSASTHVS